MGLLDALQSILKRPRPGPPPRRDSDHRPYTRPGRRPNLIKARRRMAHESRRRNRR